MSLDLLFYRVLDGTADLNSNVLLQGDAPALSLADYNIVVVPIAASNVTGLINGTALDFTNFQQAWTDGGTDVIFSSSNQTESWTSNTDVPTFISYATDPSSLTDAVANGGVLSQSAATVEAHTSLSDLFDQMNAASNSTYRTAFINDAIGGGKLVGGVTTLAAGDSVTFATNYTLTTTVTFSLSGTENPTPSGSDFYYYDASQNRYTLGASLTDTAVTSNVKYAYRFTVTA